MGLIGCWRWVTWKVGGEGNDWTGGYKWVIGASGQGAMWIWGWWSENQGALTSKVRVIWSGVCMWSGTEWKSCWKEMDSVVSVNSPLRSGLKLKSWFANMRLIWAVGFCLNDNQNEHAHYLLLFTHQSVYLQHNLNNLDLFSSALLLQTVNSNKHMLNHCNLILFLSSYLLMHFSKNLYFMGTFSNSNFIKESESSFDSSFVSLCGQQD